MSQYNKEYYEAHKEEFIAYNKAYYQEHKEDNTARCKKWREANKDKVREYHKKYKQTHWKADVNTSGQPKHSVRMKSRYYLSKQGKIIPGYEIHHCFTYNEPYKFIYCSKEIHHNIHAYLREHNIDADSNHYEQIKHLLDETVVLYGV